MTTPSGNITLGNVATELGVGLPLTLGDAQCRALAGIPSGPITLGQLRGKNKNAGTSYPPAGQLLSTYCSGTQKWGNYTNGSGGSYAQLIDGQSVECGYVAPLPYGTYLRNYCSGFNLVVVRANGSGGEYEYVESYNSPACGYQTYPAAGTLLSTHCGVGQVGQNEGGSTGNPYALVGTYADGKGGTYDQIIENYSTQCGYNDPGNGGG